MSDLNLIIKRKWLTDDTSIGHLFANDQAFCVTLEDKMRDVKILKVTAIPLGGPYPVTMRKSVHFGKVMPHIENVQGFTEIMFHWGCFAKDTDGCVLVGEDYNKNFPNFIGHSKVAFLRLYSLIDAVLKSGDRVWVTVCMDDEVEDKRTSTK